jgi:hypothetical protein
MNVVQLSDYREPPQKSQYELYQLPFFAAERRCTWKVQSTGNYSDDHNTGEAYAIEFLKSCDGSTGWTTLLPQIVGDMIGAGPEGTWPDGGVRINGIVIGFMRTIGRALATSFVLSDEDGGGA